MFLDSTDNQVSLQAASNTSSQKTTNSSSSGSIGLSLSAQGLSATASASKGKGKSDGQGTSYTNARVGAGNAVVIQSGGDTNIKGAVVAANQIKADVGGSLTVQSLQDTNTYNSSQKSSGFSISVPITGGDFGASVSASKSKIDSNFQSVNEQSGLKAGDGGFQVSVANNTSLTGGVISSTQTPIDNKQNSFTTGGQLTLTDVQNTASFTGKASGFSIDVGAKGGGTGITGVGVGMGSDKGSAASTTTAGISGIAGNTAVRTGDAETGLKPIFYADKVQRNIDAQVAITTAFTKQLGPIAAKGIFSLLESMARPASAPTVANPTPAADKIIKSDQDTRAGFNTLQADPKLDAPAKAFFADLSNAYDNSPIQGFVSDAKTDPQGYQQRVSPPPPTDSHVKDPADPVMLPVVGPLLLGPVGSAPSAAGTASAWDAAMRNGGVTYDPAKEMWISKSGGMISDAALREIFANSPGPLQRVADFVKVVQIYVVNPITTIVTGKPGTPLPPPAPITTPISSPPDTNLTTTPADQPRPVVTTGGSQIAPALPGGNSTVSPTATPQGVGIMVSQNGQGNNLPVPVPTKALNDLTYGSNAKHSPGPQQPPDAGTEPQNSLGLFGASIPSPKRPNEVRFTVDGSGEIHRFSYSNIGTWHWSGSTSDSRAPLDSSSQIPIEIRRLPNVKTDIRNGRR